MRRVLNKVRAVLPEALEGTTAVSFESPYGSFRLNEICDLNKRRNACLGVQYGYSRTLFSSLMRVFALRARYDALGNDHALILTIRLVTVAQRYQRTQL